ncbi:alpha/beta fold hydrolase [Larkinella soli]|uniref:alpha/beta fold hydrolase n=1 Tax=Larkinella soli TaxID=1770527 RepID=UPI0013E3C126|nr:alpha/beta fold hydrolase [Larkinella soli]
MPKTYLLVHGANDGAWVWKKVVPLLQAQGHRVAAIDLPGHGEDKTPPEAVTLEDYAEKVVKVANAQPGPVILVGHSSGGISIAQAAERLGTAKVEKLIFLDAFLPKNGESALSLAERLFPPSPTGEPTFADSFIFDSTGATFTLDPAKVDHFLYHDCSAEDQAFAKAHAGKQPIAPLATPVQVSDAVYGAIPKYYILCTEARNGDMSEMAKNVPTRKIVTLPTSHSPFFSRPQALVDLIVSF